MKKESYLLNPLVWLLRFRHRRGYGVHSPFAFSFLTDVVYEKGHYYAFKELDLLLPFCVSLLHLRPWKKLHLLFRLANFQHPKNAVFIGENALSFEAMKKAVPTAEWQTSIGASTHAELLYTDAPTIELLDCLDAHSMLIVDDLRHNPSFWQRVKADQRVALTFDLYDLGIVFFDHLYNRMDYTVCF